MLVYEIKLKLCEPAGSLAEDYFHELEKAMLGIPHIQELSLTVPNDEIKLFRLKHVPT